MKSILLALIVGGAVVSGLAAQTQAASAATSQASVPANATTGGPAPTQRSAAELEKLVEPIALHPDPLIAIILPASAYPLEIVQAARFVKDTNNISKVDAQPWDDNVKDVAKFPELIAKMDADLPWTMDLGQAFIDQPKELMDAIQNLRGKAKKAGTLQTSPQQIVTVTNIVVQQTNLTEVVNVTKEVVQVVPANPQVVYVPSYPPTVYYPPPAYVYNPWAPLVSFGVGMAWGAVLANNCNWGHGNVDVNVNRNSNRNVNRSTDRNRSQASNRTSANARSGTQKWQPNQSRMQQSGAKGSAAARDSRGWGSGGANPSAGNLSARASSGNAGTRASSANAGTRASTANAGTRGSAAGSQRSAGSASSPGASSAGAGRSSSPSGRSRSSSGGSAFSGVSNGSKSSSYSNRGASSRSGGGGGGASRGGGSRGGGSRGGGGGRR